MNKKVMLIAVTVLTATVALAGPCGVGCHPSCRPCPSPCRPHSYDWNHGGRQDFWTSFAGAAAGAVIGGVVSNITTPRTQTVTAVPATTVVAQQPTYVQPVQQQIAYQAPVQVNNPNYAGQVINSTCYYKPNHPIIAPGGAVVNPYDQPVLNRTKVWVGGSYIPRQQANGACMMQYVPGHYEYQ